MLLVFDGDCGFCRRCASWIDQRLPANARVAAWQTLELSETPPTRTPLREPRHREPPLTETPLTETPPAGTPLSVQQARSAAWWVSGEGECAAGHAAIGKALIATGGVWALVGSAIIAAPGSWLARPAYWIIAENRHRLSGNATACGLPAGDPDTAVKK